MRNSLIVAIVLLVLYDLLIEYGPRLRHPVLQSQWQENQYAVEKYLRDSKSRATHPQVVYVGSSLTRRLDFMDDSGCIYNLSLNGDSALTGLHAILKAPFKPGRVFVEINVPQLPANQDLIDKATGFFKGRFAMFRIENMPSNLAMSFLHSLSTSRSANPVNETVRQHAIEMATQSFKEPLPTSLLNQNMAEFQRVVAEVEAQGSSVEFFELPVYSDLENSPRAVQIRSAFSGTFPHNRTIRFDELSKASTIRTVDGQHLSDDDAKAVVSNMKRYLDDVCNAPPGG